MKPYVIGISGGSGSGKTTLADNLKALRPNDTLLLHLDDYAHPRGTLPMLEGATNFDHPGAIDSRRLANDIKRLRAGHAITTSIRVPRARKPLDPPRRRVNVTLQPAPIIVVEGFLLLYNAAVREQLDTSIFLKSDIEKTVGRRANQAENEAWYIDHILKPMHHNYVAPSARHAEHVVDVTGKTPTDVASEVIALVKLRELS